VKLDDVGGRAYLAPVVAMTELPLPLQFVAAWIGTWLTRHQELALEYLKEENRVLGEKLGGRIRLDRFGTPPSRSTR
jgi:hypothetical protein